MTRHGFQNDKPTVTATAGGTPAAGAATNYTFRPDGAVDGTVRLCWVSNIGSHVLKARLNGAAASATVFDLLIPINATVEITGESERLLKNVSLFFAVGATDLSVSVQGLT